jgi:hypothetical protein
MVWIAVFVVLCGFFLLLNLAAWRGRLDREVAQFAQSFKFSTGILRQCRVRHFPQRSSGLPYLSTTASSEAEGSGYTMVYDGFLLLCAILALQVCPPFIPNSSQT